ncbi:MAG TPA: hypothetical protein VME66_14555 [Candidatus Acidoferrales bacterium]|nr:hypothetical protein [Candidatus Acidoferrales bacterium]
MDFDLSHLDEVRSHASAALREAQARGASLFSADDKGQVFELTADGHLFAVELRGDHLARTQAIA